MPPPDPAVGDERGTLAAADEKLTFPSNAEPTLGVELEIWLVDEQTKQLAPRAADVIAALGEPDTYKAELFQSIVEVTTGVCKNVGEVRRDLSARLGKLRGALAPLGLTAMCTGTHPFANYQDVPVSDGERYQRLVNAMQWPARRLLICGTHVHVGVKSGEHAIVLLNTLSSFLPHLAALAGSSPFWLGRDTGLSSTRIKVFEGLPTAGLPPRITNWNEFVQLMRTLKAAGSISSIREIWWDIRPHPIFGTIEMRICDGINTLREVCAATAFTQCLVVYFQRLYDEGEPLPILQFWTLRENKWRAVRYGEKAHFIRNERGTVVPLEEHTHEWVERLMPTAQSLGCAAELADVPKLMQSGNNSRRQRRVYERTGNFEAVVESLTNEMEKDAVS
jgi:glutamate---cysteine ligase / carboxylate-amine ligase